MGYRSTVAYKIKFDEQERFTAFLTEAKLDPNTERCFDESTDYFELDEEKLEFRFLAEDVKWYEDDYPDVMCHMNLLKKAKTHNSLSEDENKQAVCSFLYRRIGEEDDDVDFMEGGDPDYDCIYFSRQITVDWK